jgi:nicotinate phosphoribosyltransferase
MNAPAQQVSASQGESLGLFTDLYELTMAQAYWASGTARTEAVFHLFFRQAPFQSGFTVACGLQSAMEFLQALRFDESDRAYLAQVKGHDGQPLFSPAFLKALAELRFTCDVEAVPEGTVVFPYEPLLRVQGPIWEAQLAETALLNLVNFQTLIATKAARVCLAANGDPVIEFGLRRAQGIDGGLTASRAAYVGGCAGTSNLMAGQRFGIPVAGTHAHSWVMSFASETEAFDAYAQAAPNNCVFLVDTYDSLEGVRHAVEVGRRLRQQGHKLVGVRLDSGDLAYLSIEARKILDDAGFKDTFIVGSNDLDEHLIESLKLQGARISVWGVGTRLVTGYDQPALGGVYKLSAIRKPDGAWERKIKLSEQLAKVTDPGILQVRRFHNDRLLGDAIYDITQPPPAHWTIVHPLDPTRRKQFALGTPNHDLLVPVLRQGKAVYVHPPLQAIRERTRQQLAMLHPAVKRFVNPHPYPAGLELGLHRLKIDLILKAKRLSQAEHSEQDTPV